MTAFVRLLPRRDGPLAPVNRPLLVGLVLVALATAVQLIPLSHETLTRLNPATDRFLLRYDLQYAAMAQTEALRAGGKASAFAEATADKEALPYRSGEGGAQGGDKLRPYESKRSAHPLSIDPPQTALGLSLLCVFGVFLLGLARGLRALDVRRLAPSVVALGVVLALVGMIQKATYSGKIYGFWQPYATDAGPFGPFVNRNHFAGWMVMALSLGVGYFGALVSRGMRNVKPGWRHKVLWFSSADANRVILVAFGLLVMGLSLVMTLSRSGITCFAIALAISGFAAVRGQGKRSKRALVGGYLVMVFVLTLGWTGIDVIVSRFEQAEGSYASRQAIWNDALRVFNDFPLFGSGIDTFGTAMVVYQTADPTVHYAEAHNDYLQLLSEGGMLVTVPALVLLVLFAREVRRRFRDDTDDSTTYWIRVGAVTGLLAIGLQETVEFSLQMPGNAALFCTLMAIAAARLPHRGGRVRSGGRDIQKSEVKIQKGAGGMKSSGLRIEKVTGGQDSGEV